MERKNKCGVLGTSRNRFEKRMTVRPDEQATQKASLTKPSLDYKETRNVTPYCEEARSVFNSDDEPENGEEFHQRVEKHGNKFGLRWRKKPIESVPRQLTSNDHAMSKENHGTHIQLSAQTKMKVTSTKEVLLQDLEEATTQYLSCPDPTKATAYPYLNLPRKETKIKASSTREEILGDIQEATLQYLSCADPTEKEARRHRVTQSEARGQVEETIASILANSTAEGSSHQDKL
ncbi:hypothetical protein Bca4012_052549 [Brassica carinata]